MPPSKSTDFPLHQSGGAILEVGKDLRLKRNIPEVYFTVGDFIKLGYSGERISTTTKSIIGSLLKCSSETKYHKIASGFRNPQGISYLETKFSTSILQSEHGPRGGDELNLVIKDKFYRWPNFSLGTQYSSDDSENVAPLKSNTLGALSKPIFSWLPSIGTSKVHQVKSWVLREFWADSQSLSFGDILVVGMGNQTLHRLRITDSRVIYSEPIFLGYRVRTLTEAEGGNIIFVTDSGLRILVPRKK
jgi:glucose/arabinose dehydrogenase